jgi:cellulose synthase/poly-beta-1,6-N-acetylglucosamine synthase-like glycosyltransferase
MVKMIIETIITYLLFSTAINTLHIIQNWRNIHKQEKLLEKNIGENISKLIVICPCKINNMTDSEVESFKTTLRILIEKRDIVKKTIIVIDENDNIDRIGTDIDLRNIEFIRINSNLIEQIKSKLSKEPLYGKTRALIIGTIQALKNSGFEGLLYIDCDNMINPKSIDIVSRKILRSELITGYRWYVLDSIDGTLYNLVSSVAFEGMGFYRSRIVWGGFMCIRRDLLQQYSILEKWIDEFADDALVKKVFSDNNRNIVYCPQCLSLTPPPKSGVRSFLEWSRRQLYIVKLYTPRGFKLLVLAYLLMSLNMAIPILLLAYVGFNIYTQIAILAVALQIIIGMLRGLKHYMLVRKSWRDISINRELGLVDKTQYIVLYILLNSIKAIMILPILLDLYRVRRLRWRGAIYCIARTDKNAVKIYRC